MKRAACLIMALLLAFAPEICMGQRIRSLVTGQVDPDSNPLMKWFGEEPLVEALFVPTRPGGLVDTDDIKRFVRIYFPRSYEAVRSYEFILLNSPVMYHLSEKQIAWMYDAVREGAGGLSAPACMSVYPDIHDAWVASKLSLAFPNDCPAVLAAGGPMGKVNFRIIVNRDFPEPVLTPFIPLGIETFVGYKAYLIIPKDGVATLAWQIGSFDSQVPYMVTWDYEKGRTMTIGDSFGLQFWSAYAHGYTQNPYGLDILMNMVLYLTKRKVPSDVMTYHKVRMSFAKFRTRMSLLLTVAEFAEMFGASDSRIEKLISDLEAKFSEAKELYLMQEFQESNELMKSAFDDLGEVENMIIRLKERALMWVHVVEWLVTTATLLVCGVVLWSFMVRKRLYRTVGTTTAI